MQVRECLRDRDGGVKGAGVKRNAMGWKEYVREKYMNSEGQKRGFERRNGRGRLRNGIRLERERGKRRKEKRRRREKSSTLFETLN